METQVHVTWFDNLQYDWRSKSIGFDKMSYHQFNWTGVGVRPYHGSLIDDLSVEFLNSELVQAMPDDIFAYENVFGMDLLDFYRDGQALFDKSLLQKYDVLRIPLKPEIQRREDPSLFDTLEKQVDGLRHFHPKMLVKENMSSNKGVISFFKSIRDVETKKDISSSSKYCVLNTDMNIYIKIQKVFSILVTSNIISYIALLHNLNPSMFSLINLRLMITIDVPDAVRCLRQSRYIQKVDFQ